MPKFKKKTISQKLKDMRLRAAERRSDPTLRNADNAVKAKCMQAARENPNYRKEMNKCSANSMQKAREDSKRREELNDSSAQSKRKARENSKRREEINESCASFMRKARENPERREELNESSAISMRRTRENPLRREKLNESSAQSKRKARESQERREKLNESSSASMRKIRENPVSREKLNESSAACMRKARENPERREELNESSAVSMRKARENSERREVLKKSSANSMKIAREDSLRRALEKEKDVTVHRQKRLSQIFRTSEREKDCTAHKQMRLDPLYRTPEKERDCTAHQQMRLDPLYRTPEKERDCTAHQQMRLDPLYRTQEKERDCTAHQQMRLDPLFRTPEKERDCTAHQQMRLDPLFRTPEKERDCTAHQQMRLDPLFRTPEKERDCTAHQQMRLDPLFRTPEKERDCTAHQQMRLDPLFRTQEKDRDATSRRRMRLDTLFRTQEKKKENVAKNLKRKNPLFRIIEQNADSESHRKKRRLERSRYELLLEKYLEKVRRAPSSICSCCGGLFYVESTVATDREYLKLRNCTDELIDTVLHVPQNNHRLCNTCKISVITRKRIPKLCLSNGFDFPRIPPELEDLSPLEERLVALRIPFMQIRLLGAERQSLLRGNVVNVENDLDICAQVLPRKFDETSTVQVQFMRRMKYRKPYLYETIRPRKVYEAAKFLINTELYKSENVILCEEWSNAGEESRENFICNTDDPEPSSLVEQNHEAQTNRNAAERDPNFDDCIGNAESNNCTDFEEEQGADETLVFRESDLRGIRIAPGEGNVPMALFSDLQAEELSFPSIYCGIERRFKEGIKVSYTDIAKSELRRYDRRACKPSKLLYSFKKSFNEKVSQAIQICMRKKTGKTPITVKTLRTNGFIENLVHKDEGYAVFKNLRSSPSYWKEKTKKVIAMVRQLGKCTFFITLSAAETKWTELLVMLQKIVNNEDITEEDASSMPFEKKAELIRKDPVTCMRHFDHRFRALLTLLMKEKEGLFSPYELRDYFSRMEFQMRGSPHMHGLYWIKDAPFYNEEDENSVADCIEFIDNFITCERSEEGKMEKLIGYQIHKHSQTCRKKQKTLHTCRFGFPKPPMEATMILKPLPNDLDPTTKKNAKELFSKIQTTLDSMGRGYKENVEYNKFLESLNINHLDYIQAVRSSIKRTTVFLKRSTNAIFINPYNRLLLEAWGANIDIQFVLDTYACAKYCVGYIMKSEGGVSKLLQAATKDAKNGNTTISNKLRKFANILINGSEISAQEAAAFLLGIPNTSCSRQDVFINTAHPDERIGILKSNEELDELGDDSEDVCAKGIVERYSQRPHLPDMEELCLAEFASKYEFIKARKSTKSQNDDNEDMEDDVVNDESLPVIVSNDNYFELLDKSGRLRKRRIQKIIRFRHYGKAEDPINYNREQLMLFFPWRNEDAELLEIDPIEKATQHKDQILANSQDYYSKREIDDVALTAVLNELEDDDISSDYDGMPDNDIEQQLEFDENNMDILNNATTGGSKVERFLPPRQIHDEEYKNLMRSLNDKQRRFVLHVLHLVKCMETPFYNFLSGGAGVGKSHVITAIIQSYLRFNSTMTQEHNLEETCVLVSAPTGKAAFNVFGMTLHGTFRLPPSQYGGKVCDLDDGAVNTLRVKLAKTKLFIVDEISMVSVKQLYDIDQRLRQVYCTDKDFGGKSVIVVGHLRQLPPVAGTYVFKAPKHLPLGECVGNHLWAKFQLFELDEIMRQKGEWDFCKALNNMAEGCMDDKDISLLKSREITETNKPFETCIKLFRTNKECQDYNALVHRSLGTVGALSVAYDQVQGKGTDAEKQCLLEYAKKLTPQQSDGLPYETRLQVGGEYFVSTNVDVPDGLFNGSTGCLKWIDRRPSDGSLVPICAWMDFRNPLIGITARSRKQQAITTNNINPDWVPIGREKRNLSKTGRHHGLQIFRKQIPLVAANGMTIAKSQGSSLPLVVVNVKRFNNRKISRELLYVACSRATSLNGLFIDGEFEPPNAPSHNDPVTLEMARLRTKGFLFSTRFLKDFDDSFQKLYFHNVQSFPLYYKDILADLPGAMSSNVLAFVEPHLLGTHTFDFEEYTCIHRSNCKQTNATSTNSEGAYVLAKASIIDDVSLITSSTGKGNSGHCVFVQWQISNVNIIMVYKSPKYPHYSFSDKLADMLRGKTGNIIVVGDININLQKTEGQSIIRMFQGFGLQSKLKYEDPSTNGGTHIDIFFSNFEQVDAWFYESYYSYHKPICAVWPKII